MGSVQLREAYFDFRRLLTITRLLRLDAICGLNSTFSTLLFICLSACAILKFFKEFLALLLTHILQVTLKLCLSRSIAILSIVEACYSNERVLSATISLVLLAYRDLSGGSCLGWVSWPHL